MLYGPFQTVFITMSIVTSPLGLTVCDWPVLKYARGAGVWVCMRLGKPCAGTHKNKMERKRGRKGEGRYRERVYRKLCPTNASSIVAT